MVCRLVFSFLFSIIFFLKSYTQQIILVEKDSSGKIKFKELPFIKTGIFDGFVPFKINVFTDSIVTLENKMGLLGDGLKKCVYIVTGGELVKIREDSATYIPERKGYYIFKDGSKITD